MMRPQERAAAIAYRGISVAVQAAGLPAKQVRSIALYLLVTGCNVPGAVAATAAHCSKQNVSKQIRKIEDQRDDPDFDHRLTDLEELLLSAGGAI